MKFELTVTEFKETFNCLQHPDELLVQLWKDFVFGLELRVC